MILKGKIEKILKHTPRLASAPHGLSLVNPNREWVIGIAITTILFIGGGVYAGVLFSTESKRDYLDRTATNVEAVPYKHELIHDVLEVYAAKKKHFNDLRDSRTVSLPPATTTSEAEEIVAEEGDIRVE